MLFQWFAVMTGITIIYMIVTFIHYQERQSKQHKKYLRWAKRFSKYQTARFLSKTDNQKTKAKLHQIIQSDPWKILEKQNK